MKHPNVKHILNEARAERIPAGSSGLWYITKIELMWPQPSIYRKENVVLPPGDYTHLRRITNSTLYHCDPPGEVVMEDTPFELRTHLEFMLKASGKVLVSGLGLGCVVRGLLANDNVEHVTCLENSRDVLRLVEPWMPSDRLTIIEADALEWTAKNKEKFDYAWHDVWTNRDEGEPHLDIWHGRLLINCARYVRHQGAWKFERKAKKLLQRKGLSIIA